MPLYAHRCELCLGTGEITRTVSTAHPYGDTYGVETIVEGDVCPDCDGTGIGDETEDPTCWICGDAIFPDDAATADADYTVHAECHPRRPTP